MEFSLRAVRQILNIFDLDLWLQSHIGDLNFLLNLHTTCNQCAKYEHP